MVLEDQTRWKLRRRQWTGTTEQLIEYLESTYDNAPSYTGESEPLFYNYLRPLTSLDEGLYALTCEEDVRCLATLVRSYKLIEVYIEHGVTALDSYIRPPRFSMDVPFDNIGVTNLVPDDVLEGEGVDVINLDGFDSDPSEDDKISNYRRRRMRARCDGKVHVFTMSQGTGPTGPNYEMEAGPSGSSGLKVQISMSKAFRAKAKAEREIRGDHVLQYSILRDYVVELQSTNPHTTVKILVERNIDPYLPTRVFQRIYICLGALKLGFRACRRDLLGLNGAFMKGAFPGQVLVAVGLDSNNEIYLLAYALVEAKSKSSWCWFLQCLGDDIDLHPNLNFTFISDRQKGWCGQAYKDLLCRSASATSVKEFEKCMLELKKMNPKTYEWLNKIPPEHWARSYFLGRAKSNLLLNNICEVFNGKIVGGRDKPVITLLEYIREYCMKRIVNVQSVIDKCTGPLTLTTTKIMKSIKKEAHFMKVQWNRAKKYQVSGSLGDQYVVDVMATMQKPVVVHLVIGLPAADGQCGAGGAGVGVGSQGSSRTRWTKRRVQQKELVHKKELPLNLKLNLLPILKC
ncbi:heat stress transcription factor B-4-like protein [Tanacetum coccineum]